MPIVIAVYHPDSVDRESQGRCAIVAEILERGSCFISVTFRKPDPTTPSAMSLRTVLLTAALYLATQADQTQQEFVLQFQGSVKHHDCSSPFLNLALALSILATGGCTFEKNVGQCQSKASSQALKALVSLQDAISFDVTQTGFGTYAIMNSTITVQPDNTFTEKGLISFGTHFSRDHVLYVGNTASFRAFSSEQASKGRTRLLIPNVCSREYSSFKNSGHFIHYTEMGEQLAYCMQANVTLGQGKFAGAEGMVAYQVRLR